MYAVVEAEGMRATGIGTNGGELPAVLGTDLLGEREKLWAIDLRELRAAPEVALKDRS